MIDLVIQGGMLYDGTGGPARRADVGFEGDRIALVGDLAGAPARQRLDVTGSAVMPGFIDVHSHSDLTVLANPGFESTLRQGVTTEVVGNCGLSVAPLDAQGRGVVARRLQSYGYDGPVAWSGVGGYLAQVSRTGFSANLVWLVGHGALRTAAGIRGAAVDAGQLGAMRADLEEALEAGAAGISSGLEYDPGRQAPDTEVVALASVVGSRGGFYTSHIRNRDAHLVPAVEEFIEVARRTGVRGQVSHLNVRYDTGAQPDAWDHAVDRIDVARRAGIDVMADATPFTFGLGVMANVLPDWIVADGPGVAARRLSDRATRDRLRGDVDRYWRFLHRGQWHRARPLNSREHPELNGLSFDRIAAQLGCDPWDAYFDLLAAAGADMGTLFMVGDLFREADIVDMIRHPLFLLGADTMSSRLDGPMAELTRHDPIAFAGHVHFLVRYWRELGVLPLEQLVWKLTGMPAERFGLLDRGTIRPGAAADVVVLRPDALEEHLSPPDYCGGIDHVFVNGVHSVESGVHTGARSGRHLRPA